MLVKSTIWLLQTYDQPNGQSDRSAVYAKYLGMLGYNVVLFTNNYCNFRKQLVFEVNGNHEKDKTAEYTTIWLKTFPYKGNFGRFVNMFENSCRTMLAARKMENPDIIIVPSVPPVLALTGIFLSRFYKCKLIYEIRDVWPSALIDSGVISKYDILACSFRLIEKFAYRKANAIVSTLDNVYAHVHSTNPNQIIEYIPNAVDLKTIKITEKPFSTKKKFEKHVYYVGGFGIDHDVLGIMHVALLLKNKGIIFHLYGDGPKIKQCEKFKLKHNLHNVNLQGVLKKSDIMSTLSSADIVIAAITDSDTYKFGLNLNKMMLYLACGKPIIFSGNVTPKYFENHYIGFTNKVGDFEACAKNILAATRLTKEKLSRIRIESKLVLQNELAADTLSIKYEKLICHLMKG